MFSKCLIVLWTVGAISCSHNTHGLTTGLPVQHPVVSVISSQQTPVVQPIVRNIGIPSVIGSNLLPVSNFQIPQTVPQYLLSLPRNANFEIPQSIPVRLLTITAPGAVAEPIVQPLAQPLGLPLVQPLGFTRISTTLVSPALRLRSQPAPISSTPNATPVLNQLPQIGSNSQSSSIPRLESNAISGSQSISENNERSTGFSTPTGPLNFAPNLPEVNKPSETPDQQTPPVGNSRAQQNSEPTPQRIETPQPLAEQRIESQPQTPPQPLTQQRIESEPQPITQQRIESEPQPITQQRIEPVPQPITQQRIEQQPITQQRTESVAQPLNQVESVGQLNQRFPSTQLGAQRPQTLNSYTF